MKWLLTPLLWVLALGLAAVVAWRLWRGRPILLRGRWSLRVVRMVAVVLVVLGFGAEHTPAAPAEGKKTGRTSEPSPEPAPPFTSATVSSWVSLMERNGSWEYVKRTFTQIQLGSKLDAATLTQVRANLNRVPPGAARLLAGEIDALKENKPAPVATLRDLSAALEEAEKFGSYDPWLTAYVWRQAGRSEGDAAARIALYGRLAEHARKANALIKARPKGQGLLMNPRAWMSKAGPRPGAFQAHQAGLKVVTEAAIKAYYKTDLGTWERDGMASLTVDAGSAPGTLYEGGDRRALHAGRTFRWHRLDLLQTADGKPVTLTHAAYGKVDIPGGKLVSVHDLPAYLSETGRKAVERDVADAMKGDEVAAGRLEKALPLVHKAVRKELAASPSAKGAARLRLILSLFDDAVMPAPPAGMAPGVVPRRMIPRP